MFTFRNIYKAYKLCRKNKTNTINALKFEQNLLENLWELTYALQNRSYTPGTAICFLASSPKLREIFAADFGDRIAHHVLIGEIEEMYEKKFIYDVYNNRKNRGTHQAAKRVKGWMQNSPNGYYLQLDIKGFFYHLNKDILYKKLYTDIHKTLGCNTSEQMHDKNQTNDNILWLAHRLIYHDPTKGYLFKGDRRGLEALPPHKTLFKIPKNRGLPIGNLTSRFFANVYMNDFDHFIKRELKVKRYVRYVDDFVILDESKEILERLYEKIKLYLHEKLQLSLRVDTKLKQNKEGLDFLGYIIRPRYILVRQRVVNNYKFKKQDIYKSMKTKKEI